MESEQGTAGTPANITTAILIRIQLSTQKRQVGIYFKIVSF